ncbi:MAG: class I SAM-dependent methyltransferase [Candidatus Electrothrix sp. AU1_5]|nr:class I SAM-dependent methyltransferase [Candidatus Electrothrix gigas]
MAKVKEIAKKVPLLLPVYRMLRNRYISYQCYQLKAKDTDQVFTDIYKNNKWGKNSASASGPGSDVHQTRIIVNKLPAVFSDFGISTILDIPCGDFYWMKNVDFVGIDYTGADIVNELIEKNIEQYQRHGVHFQTLNLITDELPKVDLVFCRDCLVHLSFEDIFCALKNLCNSQSKYILTTTFTRRTDNHDIATGQWRTLNLELAPFMLPRPLKVISEGCTEGGGNFSDKSLGLWRIADIRECLTRRST